MSQVYFLYCSTFAPERLYDRIWGRKTCFLPWAPSYLGTPLLVRPTTYARPLFFPPIQWEPVEYFNNKVICDLIEERHRGIIDILDEECLRPGDATDQTFLKKLEETVGEHAHFVT